MLLEAPERPQIFNEENEEKLYQKYRKTATSIDPNEVKKLNRPFTVWGKIVSVLFIMLCIWAIWRFTERAGAWYLLGGIMFAYLLIKEIFALLYTPYTNELTKDYKVSIILTCFNENPTSVVAILENILALDYPVYEVLFLDDGSEDPLAYEVAKSFIEDHQSDISSPIFKAIRFSKNRGKRALLIDGFRLVKGDYVFLLDSDSEILPNALSELLRPFEDEKTSSCVGNIGIINRNENFLTKLQSVTYFGSFQLGRAAQSISGDVAVCSGAFTVHKKEFILDHLKKLEGDKIFGISLSSGDDRALTSFSKISGGKTRYQSTAYCETLVPNRWKKFQSQRRRWQRSAYLGVLISINSMFPKKLLYLFWAFAETYLWLIATIIFIIEISTRGFKFDIIDIILFHCIIMFKHNCFYMLYNPLRFLFVPITTFVYALSLLYTRIHALITITDDGWGTRNNSTKKVLKTKRRI